MTTQILNGDCLELMKNLEDKSVDLLICDLPYGETNCKWDSVIDLELFWKEFKRIRKSKRTACIHFCSTKFGFSLIKSWEKGYKMDLCWVKRNRTGGLQSRYRPMRGHEMVYFFYEQAPKYNRDKYHKRINNVKHAKSDTTKEKKSDKIENKIIKREKQNFEPPNPVSVLEENNEVTYDKEKYKEGCEGRRKGQGVYGIEVPHKHFDYFPPNPASVLEEKPHINIHGLDKSHPTWGQHNSFAPPNPASVLEEDLWGENKKARHERYLECGCGNFEPRQPDSVFKSEKVFIGKRHHQTEKPQDIIEFFLKYWSDEGDVILDPTMGSGSTGVACKKLKRNFIGFELNEKIFEVAKKRIE